MRSPTKPRDILGLNTISNYVWNRVEDQISGQALNRLYDISEEPELRMPPFSSSQSDIEYILSQDLPDQGYLPSDAILFHLASELAIEEL